MATNDGSGNGESNYIQENKVHSNNGDPKITAKPGIPGSFSRKIMMVFAYLVLVGSFILSIFYMSDISAINKMHPTDQEKLENAKSLYVFYVWFYPVMGVIIFSVLNVLNAIYIKVYNIKTI